VWCGLDSGLLPFVALAAGSLATAEYAALCRVALVLYGALILSFVGALHWAFAMTLPDLSAAKRTECFIWSVVPALLAWPAAMLLVALPAQISFASIFFGYEVAAAPLIIGFVANYIQDIRLARVANLPAWYSPLRLRLTAVACVCLAAAGFTHLLR
jgi:Protein of unknown function (DUF3429)